MPLPHLNAVTACEPATADAMDAAGIAAERATVDAAGGYYLDHRSAAPVGHRPADPVHRPGRHVLRLTSPRSCKVRSLAMTATANEAGPTPSATSPSAASPPPPAPRGAGAATPTWGEKPH